MGSKSVGELLALVTRLIPFVRVLASLYLDNNNCIYLDSAGFRHGVPWSIDLEYIRNVGSGRCGVCVVWCGVCFSFACLESAFPYSLLNFPLSRLCQTPQFMGGSECITEVDFFLFCMTTTPTWLRASSITILWVCGA